MKAKKKTVKRRTTKARKAKKVLSIEPKTFIEDGAKVTTAAMPEKAKRLPKRKNDGTITLTNNINLEVPIVFCVINMKDDSEAIALKNFLNISFHIQGSNFRFETYKISPMKDSTYLFHLKDHIDVPEEVQFYTLKSFFDGNSVEIKAGHMLHRLENDFKTLTNYTENYEEF